MNIDGCETLNDSALYQNAAMNDQRRKPTYGFDFRKQPAARQERNGAFNTRLAARVGRVLACWKFIESPLPQICCIITYITNLSF